MIKKLTLAALLFLPSAAIAFEFEDPEIVFAETINVAKCRDSACVADQISDCVIRLLGVSDGICYGGALQQADGLLNKLYKDLIKSAKFDESVDMTMIGTQYRDPDKYLRESQRAWIKTRDNTCEFERRLNFYNTGYEDAYNVCKALMSYNRYLELKLLVSRNDS